VENLREIAHRIIDMIEDKICYDNPKVDLLRGKHKGNTLLYGEGYYELEDAVVQELNGGLHISEEDIREELEYGLEREPSEEELSEFKEFLLTDVPQWLVDNRKIYIRKLLEEEKLYHDIPEEAE